MEQGALGAAGVRRVGYGLEMGRSVRTAGGVGAYCVATRTACFIIIISSSSSSIGGGGGGGGVTGLWINIGACVALL